MAYATLARRGAKYLILNSILAAVLVLAVQALGDQNDVIWLCVGTLALLLFIFDAEKTADAVLRDKPSRMVRYHNVYNFAVLLLLLSLAALVSDHVNWDKCLSGAAFTVAAAFGFAVGGLTFITFFTREIAKLWLGSSVATSRE